MPYALTVLSLVALAPATLGAAAARVPVSLHPHGHLRNIFQNYVPDRSFVRDVGIITLASSSAGVWLETGANLSGYWLIIR